MHAANKTDSVQKMSAPLVKQAHTARHERRLSIFKKSFMKNKKSGEAAAPANADQLSSNGAEKQLAFTKHCENRRLPTDTILNYLQTQFPKQYELAEVVGKWIWLDSPAKTKRLASGLWLLGFHWNDRRGVWQHPCGKFDPIGSHPADPRIKYGSYFVADVKPI
jgi:hypothetical protein